MARILVLAALVYGYGDPGFDGHRPEALDCALQRFHQAVDVTAGNAQRVLISIDNNGNRLSSLPMLGDKLRQVGAALTPG
jgi:hypothetical protein